MRFIDLTRSALTRPAVAAAVAATALAGAAAVADAAPRVSGASVKQGSLPGNRVKPNSLTGVQINESRLGVVPVAKLASFAELAKSADRAKDADHATNADHATSADTARTADTARSAETARSADDAKKLGGREPSAYMAGSIRTVFAASAQISGAEGSTTITASCNPNERAIGGGGGWFQVGLNATTELDAKVTASVPSPTTAGTDTMTGWTVSGRNSSGANRILRAYAICTPKLS